MTMRWLLAAVLVVLPAAPVAAADDALKVSPGRIDTLRMGTSLTQAERQGWVAPAALCDGWTAGPKALLSNRHGEVFKAFPTTVTKRRVLSMWATGNVVSTRGIRTRGLGARAHKGSSVTSLREAYPALRKLGRTTVRGASMPVYSIAGPSGHLDFFVADRQVSFVVVRTAKVDWRRPATDGC
jgi:hypothetical protein